MFKKIHCFMLLMLVSCICYSQNVEVVLKGLEKSMADMRSLDTEFEQSKRLSIFNKEIKLGGKVCMQKPDLFLWQVDYPMKYKMVMDGKSMRQWDEATNKVVKMSLEKNPVLDVAIKQMTQWFSGKYVGLMNEYNIHVASSMPIVLEFVPLQSNPAKNFLEKVVIKFRNDEKYIRSIEITEKSGDSMLISFVNTKINNNIDKGIFNF